MGRKNKLFSIGEISKYTGASIKSLRYYEEIKILKPAFIDPYSSYRFYSFDQIYLIDLIMFCIELDIPLKELAKYIDENETLDYSSLLAYGKKIAKKKMRTLQRGIEFIERVEQRITLAEKNQKAKKIYRQEIPEKSFYVIPYEKPLKGADLFELAKPFFEMEYGENVSYEFIEYGYMCEYSPSDIQRYAFMELPKINSDEILPVSLRGINPVPKIIPGGTYFCTQSETSQLEEAPQIFHKQLKGKTSKDRISFLAIETDILVSKYKVNKPLHELRVIAL